MFVVMKIILERLFYLLHCPALESLDLGICTFRDMNLNISSLILKRFGSNIFHDGGMNLDASSFIGRPKLRLYAPNLTTLDRTRYKLRDYSFGNLSSLVSACIYLEVEKMIRYQEATSSFFQKRKNYMLDV